MTKRARKQEQRAIRKRYSVSGEEIERQRLERGAEENENKERLQGAFQWSNESRFPGLSKIDSAVPKLYLGSKHLSADPFLLGIYLVNNCQETLRLVRSGVGGCISSGEEVASFQGQEHSYRNVVPGEAVLVDNYDLYYDSDFLNQLDIEVESEGLGKKVFRLTGKGAFGDAVLLGEDGESDWLLEG